jgi:hypothetical protein
MRPHCPDCEARMMTIAVSERPEGLEQRTFECAKCGHTETRTIVSGPVKAGTAGGSNAFR